MSQKYVQLTIGRLLTDEAFRLRFLTDRKGTLAALRDQGIELTRAELEALMRTDGSLWLSAAELIDADLQCCVLQDD